MDMCSQLPSRYQCHQTEVFGSRRVFADAREGSQLHSLARTLARTEALSHVLAWTKASRLADPDAELVADVVEMPRLKLSLRTEQIASLRETRLYSVDHGGLYVSSESGKDAPARTFTACAPHALLSNLALAQSRAISRNLARRRIWLECGCVAQLRPAAPAPHAQVLQHS